jgi:hypothetical protein
MLVRLDKKTSRIILSMTWRKLGVASRRSLSQIHPLGLYLDDDKLPGNAPPPNTAARDSENGTAVFDRRCAVTRVY